MWPTKRLFGLNGPTEQEVSCRDRVHIPSCAKRKDVLYSKGKQTNADEKAKRKQPIVLVVDLAHFRQSFEADVP